MPDANVFERVNLDLLKTFLAEMANSGASALTYISTYEVFQAINGVIRESHPVVSEIGFSPYFQSMIRAYRLVTDFAARHDSQLVTILRCARPRAVLSPVGDLHLQLGRLDGSAGSISVERTLNQRMKPTVAGPAFNLTTVYHRFRAENGCLVTANISSASKEEKTTYYCRPKKEAVR